MTVIDVQNTRRASRLCASLLALASTMPLSGCGAAGSGAAAVPPVNAQALATRKPVEATLLASCPVLCLAVTVMNASATELWVSQSSTERGTWVTPPLYGATASVAGLPTIRPGSQATFVYSNGPTPGFGVYPPFLAAGIDFKAGSAAGSIALRLGWLWPNYPRLDGPTEFGDLRIASKLQGPYTWNPIGGTLPKFWSGFDVTVSSAPPSCASRRGVGAHCGPNLK